MLPNADLAIVEETKVTGYLLSPDHPDGHSKADFFTRFGFRLEAWEVLAEALQRHARSHSVAKTASSLWGTRYSVEGALDCPDGRRPQLRTVWIVENLEATVEKSIPRLITAYPI